MRSIRKTLCIALLVLAAAPLAAYTIYLKDGSRVVAKTKYRVEEGKAIITLQSGTQTFIDASEIDIERTEAANTSDYGTALVLEDGKFTEATATREEEADDTLTDLAATQELSIADRPRIRRPAVEEAKAENSQRSVGGYLDFSKLARKPLRNLEISETIQEVFRARGIENLQIFQGTQPEHVLLEAAANSEATVFRSIEAASESLLRIRQNPELDVAAIELVMLTAAHERAGQFVMTPEEAADLVEDRIEISAFFIERVQF